MASRCVVALLGLLIGCGPQVAVDELGTETGGSDSEGSPNTSTSGVPQPTTGTPDTTTASPSTTASPTTTSTVTTNPTADGVDDWDECASGGVDCCEINSSYCDTTGGDVPEISGEFLFVFSLSVAPDLPLQYLATVEVLPQFDPDGVLFDVLLQPLTLDQGSTTVPRDPAGDPIEVPAVLVGHDLSFELALGSVLAPGETNPITGSDITMDGVLMTGTVLGPDDLCGTVTGDVVAPINTSLEGSTFAMIRVDAPASLPEMFPLGCN